MVHSSEVRAEVLELVAGGLNDGEVARRTGVPRSTVRDLRRGRDQPSRGACLRCWRPERGIIMTSADYAQLLGLYLGDGHITEMQRTQRLRVSLDAKYPGVIADARNLLERSFPYNRVNSVRADGGATTVLVLHQAHLACLFPQHGPGKKQDRDVRLERWQQEVVARAPWALLRGLLWSDGCSFINRTGRYSYLSFEFRSRSEDIRALFASTCDLVGVEYRLNADRVRIYRRESVTLLEAEVGLKR